MDLLTAIFGFLATNQLAWLACFILGFFLGSRYTTPEKEGVFSCDHNDRTPTFKFYRKGKKLTQCNCGYYSYGKCQKTNQECIIFSKIA